MLPALASPLPPATPPPHPGHWPWRGGAGQEAGRGGYKYRSVWSSLPTAWGAGPGANREAVFLLTGKQAPCVCSGQTGPQTGSLEPASLPAAAKHQPQLGSPSWGVVLGALPMGGGTRGPEETLHLGSGGSPHPLPRPRGASLPGAMVVPHLPPALSTRSGLVATRGWTREPRTPHC